MKLEIMIVTFAFAIEMKGTFPLLPAPHNQGQLRNSKGRCSKAREATVVIVIVIDLEVLLFIL